MLRIPVESSDIVSIGYDAKEHVLEIEFGGGRVYQYTDVTPDVHERFMRADSCGTYFNAFINGRYRYHRIQEEKPAAAPQAVAFVTGNARKFRDMQLACEKFGVQAEQIELPVNEIQGHDPQEIAIQKAKHAYRLAGRPVVINDVYWNILALRGFPGAYMKYMLDWLRAEDFLALMQDKKDRTIGCTDTLVYYDGKRPKVFAKDLWGKIADEPKGGSGSSLPIDLIVIPDGQTRTIAEIESTEGRIGFTAESHIWHDFAKWYSIQRRLRKV